MWYPRKLEMGYIHSKTIFEFWNTISNLPFLLIGFARILQGTTLPGFYCLYIAAGICSGIHHAVSFRASLFLDWIPIFMSIAGIIIHQIWATMTLTTAVVLLMALTCLVVDHVWTPIQVPYGHVIWHILAAFAVDYLYQDAT